MHENFPKNSCFHEQFSKYLYWYIFFTGNLLNLLRSINGKIHVNLFSALWTKSHSCFLENSHKRPIFPYLFLTVRKISSYARKFSQTTCFHGKLSKNNEIFSKKWDDFQKNYYLHGKFLQNLLFSWELFQICISNSVFTTSILGVIMVNYRNVYCIYRTSGFYLFLSGELSWE
jgi:hypothetical protein